MNFRISIKSVAKRLFDFHFWTGCTLIENANKFILNPIINSNYFPCYFHKPFLSIRLWRLMVSTFDFLICSRQLTPLRSKFVIWLFSFWICNSKLSTFCKSSSFFDWVDIRRELCSSNSTWNSADFSSNVFRVSFKTLLQECKASVSRLLIIH